MTIEAKRALYIKLGEGGDWAERCIKRDQTVQMGFNEVDHSLCAQRRWEEVREQAKAVYGGKMATRVTNQLRHFYDDEEDILWITFHQGALWWCFSRPDVALLDGGYRARPVIDQWKDSDVQGQTLTLERLSGKLTMMQGFQGTLCSVKESDYLLRKINAVDEPDVQNAKSAQQALVDRIEAVIHNLHWRDFEVLVDLLFRQAGWRRISELGGTQKTLDLILDSPITGERYGVQVKSQADAALLNSYETQVADMQGFTRFYLAVHSPSAGLDQNAGKVEVLGPAKVAEWSVKYGLVDWIIDRAG